MREGATARHGWGSRTGNTPSIRLCSGVEVEYLTKRQASEVITDLDGNKPSNGNGTNGKHAWAG
jgi:hypothetical protein